MNDEAAPAASLIRKEWIEELFDNDCQKERQKNRTVGARWILVISRPAKWTKGERVAGVVEVWRGQSRRGGSGCGWARNSRSVGGRVKRRPTNRRGRFGVLRRASPSGRWESLPRPWR